MTMKVSCQKKYRILFPAKGALLLFKMLAEFLHIFACRKTVQWRETKFV